MKRLILSLAIASTLAAPAIAAERLRIGLSFSDLSIERWKVERDAMAMLLKAKGFDVVTREAHHDARHQNDQIRSLAAHGARVVIVVAEDGDLAAEVVDELAREGVRVIAYDRLIRSPRLAAYVSFDSVEVGRAQARGILAARDSGRFVLLGGSPTDNNARLVRAGQLEVLRPSLETGRITIVAEPWVENWDPARARQVMATVLASTRGGVDAVVASNDGTALGALEALRRSGLAGRVPISGQDASVDGCNAVARGELTMTVLKDFRQLAPLASEIAARLARGERDLGLEPLPLARLAGDDHLAGTVPCRLLPVSPVTRDDLRRLIIDSGFQSREGVYRNVPNPPTG